MAEATRAADRVGQSRRLSNGDPRNALHDQLRDPFTATKRQRCVSMVDRDHTDLTAVVGVDGARAVERRQPVPQSQAAARSLLSFIPVGVVIQITPSA